MQFTCCCLIHTPRCWCLSDYSLDKVAPALSQNQPLPLFFKFFVVSRLRKNPNRLQMLTQLDLNIVLALKVDISTFKFWAAPRSYTLTVNATELGGKVFRDQKLS